MALDTSKVPASGYTSESPNSFVTGAGLLVYNFNPKTLSFESFGATSGGTKISLKTNYTQLEIDGILSTPAGGDIIESTEGTMEVNLLEATAKNLSLMINGNISKDSSTGATEVRAKSRVGVADYIQHLAHISTLQDGTLMAVVFDYALPTDGLDFNPQQGETNVLTTTFSARTAPDNLDDASLPVSIFFYPASDEKASTKAS